MSATFCLRCICSVFDILHHLNIHTRRSFTQRMILSRFTSDGCTFNPCLYGGQCQPLGDGYECNCMPNSRFTGDVCGIIDGGINSVILSIVPHAFVMHWCIRSRSMQTTTEALPL